MLPLFLHYSTIFIDIFKYPSHETLSVVTVKNNTWLSSINEVENPYQIKTQEDIHQKIVTLKQENVYIQNYMLMIHDFRRSWFQKQSFYIHLKAMAIPSME